MEQSVEIMAGICFLTLGLSYMFRSADWASWLDHLHKQGRRASLTVGGLNLLIGSFIVAFHSIWEGAAIILTVIGVLAVAKGTIYLLYPDWLPVTLQELSPRIIPLLRFSGFLLLLMAGAAVYPLCQGG